MLIAAGLGPDFTRATDVAGAGNEVAGLRLAVEPRCAIEQVDSPMYCGTYS